MTSQSSINREDMSPTEFLKAHCFPLQDFELVKVYENHIQIIDNLKKIVASIDKSERGIGLIKMDKDEYQKMTKIAAEFSIRFSRNYIYPLQLQLANLDKFLISGKAMEPKYNELLKKSLTNVYQMALQAAMAYVAYISQRGRLQAREKLSTLMQTLLDVNRVCANILIPVMETVGHGAGEMLPEICNEILGKLVVAPAKKKIKEKRVKPPQVKIAVNEDVDHLASVYGGKLGTWKQKAATMAKLKQDRERKKVQLEVEPPAVETELPPQKHGHERMLVRREVVNTDDDIQTEIQRFSLHEAKTKDDNRASLNPKLRKTLLEALQLVDLGDEASALTKLKEMTANSQVREEKPSNVHYLCIRSRSMDEEFDETQEAEGKNQMESPNRSESLASTGREKIGETEERPEEGKEDELNESLKRDMVQKSAEGVEDGRKATKKSLRCRFADATVLHERGTPKARHIEEQEYPWKSGHKNTKGFVNQEWADEIVDETGNGGTEKGISFENKTQSEDETSDSDLAIDEEIEEDIQELANSTPPVSSGRFSTFEREQTVKHRKLKPLKVSPHISDHWESSVPDLKDRKLLQQQSEIVAGVSDALVDDLVEQVLNELVDDTYLQHIYQYELQAI